MDVWIRCLYMYRIILRSILIHLSDCSQTGYGHKIVIIQTRLFESLNNFSSPGPWSASWINCSSRDHTLKCLDKVVITGIVFLTPPPSSYYYHHHFVALGCILQENLRQSRKYFSLVKWSLMKFFYIKPLNLFTTILISLMTFYSHQIEIFISLWLISIH